jgi:Ca-activated chloride channel family protein
MAAAPGRYYTVVVMTDGKTNEGASFADFRAWLARQPAEVQRIRAFTVLFGDGNEQELQALAQATGGRYFDSRKSSLPSIFKEIRGYQ